MSDETFDEIAGIVMETAENLQGAITAARALGVDVTMALETRLPAGAGKPEVTLMVQCRGPRDIPTAVRFDA